MKKLIKLALLILFLLSFAYPANAATIDLVRSTVEYTDNVDQGGILEFLWNTPSLNNEEVRYLIGDIPSEFDVSEANVQISSNKGTFDKAIKSSKIALKSTTALTGNLEVKIKIPIPPDCPENTYTLEISEMVGSDSDMLSPSSIDITVQKSSTKPSTPILNDPGTTDTDGSYTVSWSSASGATSYTLEEDTSSSFSSPTLVHSGAGTSKYVTGKSNGTYYYRVKACNACGCSGWSNIVNIEVSIPHERGWNRTFGGTGNDVAYSVQQTSDGGYILAGYTGSYGAGSADFWLVKTDSKGNEQWNKTFGGTGYDIAYSVQQTSDDGYILAGCTKSYVAGSYDAWVVKTDSNGNMQWDKTLGGTDWDVAYSVQQTSDGGYILAGYTDSYGAGLDDALLVKIYSNGSIQWEKTFGGTGWDQAKAVRQTTDGGFIIAGLTGPNGIDLANVWLVKTDFNGNKRWEKTFGGNSWDTAESVQQTSDGGYILAGCTLSYGAGGSDFWLVKTDSSGNKQWDKTFGGTDEDYAYSVQQTTDGGFILAGCSAPHSSPILAGCTDLYGAGGSDAWLVKTDCNGKEQWNKTFGGTDDDYASSVQQTPGGGYILAGYTKSYGAGSADFWLIKTMGEPTELPVHNLNTEEDFSTIQAAIDDLGTKEGHTITVDHGTYKEHLVIDKPLKLMGEDKSTTIIEGGGSGNCVHVTADAVEISGFTIQNGTDGILLKSSDGCTISGNIIQDNYDGIRLTNSNSNAITNNIIFNNVFSFSGIHLSSSHNNVISDNELVENGRGISLYDSNNNLIYHNNFVDGTFKQAYDNTGTNSWDNGLTEGGNYWSDHICIGNPSAGSQPYYIDTDGVDHYPFQESNRWVKENQPPVNPVLTSDKLEPQTAGSAITWAASATDPEGDTLYYRFRMRGPATENSWQIMRDWNTGNTWAWHTSSADIGDSDISVWIRDGHHAPPDRYDHDRIYYDYTIVSSQTSVKKSDLVITHIEDSDVVGETRIVYTIKNQGNAEAGPSYTGLYIDGTYIEKNYVWSVAPGASIFRTFDCTWNCTPGEKAEIKVCADIGYQVDESDEANNCRTVSLTCPSAILEGDIIYHADYGEGIWRMHPDGTGRTQLSGHGWFTEYSPDNAKIAFGEFYQNGIYVMNADGTNQIKLTRSGNAPTWSTDGKQIAYHDGNTADKNRRIWVMNADGTNAHQLSENPGSFPKWSPNGNKIIYHGEVNNGIWLINSDGTGETLLYKSGGDPGWSPDGKKIVYSSLTDGCIWTMNADGTGKTKLTDHKGIHPTWSSDGTKIAYEDLAKNKGIPVINADGSGDHMINEEGHAPDWSNENQQ